MHQHPLEPEHGELCNLSAGIAVDGAGNVYVAGGGGPFFVAKFAPSNNGSLTQSWNEQFSGTDYATDVAVDGAGNVYTTGSFEGSVNFDQGPGTYILQSAYYAETIGKVVYHEYTYDLFLSKLDTNGNFVAAADIVSGASPNAKNNNAHAIALDSSGNIYSTGGFRGTANFNPTGTYDLTVDGGSNSPYLDVFVSQLTQPSMQPSATRGTTTLALALNLDQVLASLFVPGSVTNAAPFVADGGSQGQTKILPVTQEAFGTSLKSADPTKSVHPAWQQTTSPVMVDRLFADLVSGALADALAAGAPLAPLA
jgi:hypothetical protein